MFTDELKKAITGKGANLQSSWLEDDAEVNPMSNSTVDIAKEVTDKLNLEPILLSIGCDEEEQKIILDRLEQVCAGNRDTKQKLFLNLTNCLENNQEVEKLNNFLSDYRNNLTALERKLIKEIYYIILERSFTEARIKDNISGSALGEAVLKLYNKFVSDFNEHGLNRIEIKFKKEKELIDFLKEIIKELDAKKIKDNKIDAYPYKDYMVKKLDLASQRIKDLYAAYEQAVQQFVQPNGKIKKHGGLDSKKLALASDLIKLNQEIEAFLLETRKIDSFSNTQLKEYSHKLKEEEKLKTASLQRLKTDSAKKQDLMQTRIKLQAEERGSKEEEDSEGEEVEKGKGKAIQNDVSPSHSKPVKVPSKLNMEQFSKIAGVLAPVVENKKDENTNKKIDGSIEFENSKYGNYFRNALQDASNLYFVETGHIPEHTGATVKFTVQEVVELEEKKERTVKLHQGLLRLYKKLKEEYANDLGNSLRITKDYNSTLARKKRFEELKDWCNPEAIQELEEARQQVEQALQEAENDLKHVQEEKEKARKAEELKKQEEEQKRIEEERKRKEEEKIRLEAEERKKQEELKRQEEEKARKEAEELKRKQAEEEREKQEQEEKLRKEAEERARKEEELKKQAEEQKKIEEELKRIEEERQQKEKEERVRREQEELQRVENERIERERLERERIERERLERERIERERLERERIERERLEHERIEQERLEHERQQEEARLRQEREEQARLEAERLRQVQPPVMPSYVQQAQALAKAQTSNPESQKTLAIVFASQIKRRF